MQISPDHYRFSNQELIAIYGPEVLGHAAKIPTYRTEQVLYLPKLTPEGAEYVQEQEAKLNKVNVGKNRVEVKLNKNKRVSCPRDMVFPSFKMKDILKAQENESNN